MLLLIESLLDKPVFSLRTGGPVGFVEQPVLNPHNLKIEGFYVTDSIDKQTLILLCQDIRESSIKGYIINDHGVLAQPDDLVRLKKILSRDFQLIKKPVETVGKEKVGKVTDFAVETTTMYVQKLYVARPFWRNPAGGSLSIDRSQIVEVTDKRVVINELLQATPSAAPAVAA